MTRSILILAFVLCFQIWRTGDAASEARLRPCRGLNDPVALSQGILDLRKEHGWKNDLTGLCIDEVSALFGREVRQTKVESLPYFRNLVLLAGAYQKDDGESEIVQDLAKIIQKDRAKLEKEFKLTLPGVTGICTRQELELNVTTALCDLDHPGKGSGQDVSQDRRCSALTPTNFWDGIEKCYEKNGS
jgi:hypothetical protein